MVESACPAGWPCGKREAQMNALVCLVLITSVSADAPKADLRVQDFTGRVILGPHVKSVQLVDQYGVSAITRIDGSVYSLKPGHYRVQEVWLEGNYFYRATDGEKIEQFDLDADTPYHIQAGTPLTPHVEVSARGRC